MRLPDEKHKYLAPRRCSFKSILIAGLVAWFATVFAADQADFKLDDSIAKVMNTYCLECHDHDTKKGDIQLDNLSRLALDARLAMLNRVQEQVYCSEMPPKKKDQPSADERDAFLTWISLELKKHNASTLEDKLRYYKYGNYINHDKLFSGEIKDKPFTPARRWLVNNFIYNELVNEIFELGGAKGRKGAKGREDSFYGVVKAFNLPTGSGVSYYDNNTIEGGQYLTLMSNAKWVVDRQLRAALLKSGEFKYPEGFLNTKPGSMIYKFPGEMWNVGKTAPEFESIVMNKGFPSDADIQAAITHQCAIALQRPPTGSEMAKYMKFTSEAMKAGGNSVGLSKMMVSVMMEPDFLYRNELGDGKLDGDDRMMLTPREASYAIAYALTDRVPDDTLVKAAQSGKLNGRQDYEREVTRILADDSIEKPRIMRFFQDYFGYYNIYNVFKDEERFVGAYNPHRVVASKYTFRVPGKIAKEADALVAWILKNDKDVLGELLTSDKFFVDHNGDNAAMKAIADKAIEVDKKNRATYEKLISMDWKHHQLEAAKAGGYLTEDGKIRGAMGGQMAEFEQLYGTENKASKNRVPIPKDGEHVEHSMKMYNMDYRTWSYEAVQPFKINNRVGFLTHPAWLVSFSQNSHTDMVRRGKWIREKLLAGFIPDVPITVDATIPEDPHKTLRERISVSERLMCWRCHEKMNPLGYVFESYDDFGRFRTEEMLEYPENIIKTVKERAKTVNGTMGDFDVPIYKSKTVDSTGYLEGTGDKNLDGKVTDVNDLMGKLAKSDRVRQSFVRNVFRYFMGRNEMLSDSQTLIAADKAYVAHGGSFKALVVSLLTSDSFIYRKDTKE